MSKFLYIFRRDANSYKSVSPEDMQKIMKKWTDWRDALEKGGHFNQAGERLDPSGKVVRGTTKTVTDGPYVEVKDSVQGFMFIEAKDLDEAQTLASACPILEGDGSVEIRPIVG